jgi:hypothetical protein
MKAITRRVGRLESFAPHRDEEGRSLADIADAIRERRRCSLAAEGREPEEDPPREILVDGRRPRTLSEAIRSARPRLATLAETDGGAK